MLHCFSSDFSLPFALTFSWFASSFLFMFHSFFQYCSTLLTLQCPSFFCVLSLCLLLFVTHLCRRFPPSILLICTRFCREFFSLFCRHLLGLFSSSFYCDSLPFQAIFSTFVSLVSLFVAAFFLVFFLYALSHFVLVSSSRFSLCLLLNFSHVSRHFRRRFVSLFNRFSFQIAGWFRTTFWFVFLLRFLCHRRRISLCFHLIFTLCFLHLFQCSFAFILWSAWFCHITICYSLLLSVLLLFFP